MTRLPIQLIREGSPPVFPPPGMALEEPNGLLAIGGDLAPERLLAAYAQGIFPWFSEDEPLLWWSPDPRCVFATDAPHVSRRLRRQLAHCSWSLTVDHAFDAVIRACAEPRERQHGTWIVPAMMRAYGELHRLGHAHSVEVWDGDALIGGIYGVAVGRLFCGESMFSRTSGGSKAALLGLCRLLHAHGWPLLDAQVSNPHLLSMGARTWPRYRFLAQVAELTDQADNVPWRDTPPMTARGLVG